jgi:predicted dehydrogenase/threonine dehydrogenase-like Zn-dependent dehydrogenase
VKAVLQDFKNGRTRLADVPAPGVRSGHLLIRTTRSLLSAGTERMLVEFGRANLLEKARRQPDKVRQVLDKAKTDGLLPTIDAVMNKLDLPLPMGYCSVGVVEAVGSGVVGFAAGDRVASNGNHAETVCVPSNLCAKIPAEVDDESAAFTVLGAIALEGIRLVRPELGETCVVSGLGLVGLLCAQLLRANGCRVLGIDLSRQRIELARSFGVETVDLSAGIDPIEAGMAFSRGRGVDAVILAASTSSSEPVHQAAAMSRKRGRIVQVGVTGLELRRADFYAKELTFQVSCSYGPGRYDPQYEEAGRDYPFGYVRWTEQRNFEAVLDTVAAGTLNVAPLISHRFPFERAEDAYAILTSDEPQLGILLEYPAATPAPLERTISLPAIDASKSAPRPSIAKPSLGFIGSGNYAGQVLIPAFKATHARLHAISSSTGITGAHNGRKFGFALATTDTSRILADPDVDAVVIATRHDTHARFVCDALRAGKHVFCEKPLAIREAEVADITSVYAETSKAIPGQIVMVGFNRRFSPHVVKLASLLESAREPKSFVMTVNAGRIPSDHWTQDREVGGGRIIGEACHFIDLLRFLARSPIVDVQTTVIGSSPAFAIRDDKVSFQLRFGDGSIGTVHYLANGHRSFPKERLEVFCGNAILQLDNFVKLRGFGWPGFKKFSTWRQDKGQRAAAAAFVDAIAGGKSAPIPFHELIEVTRVTFQIAQEAAGP